MKHGNLYQKALRVGTVIGLVNDFQVFGAADLNRPSSGRNMAHGSFRFQVPVPVDRQIFILLKMNTGRKLNPVPGHILFRLIVKENLLLTGGRNPARISLGSRERAVPVSVFEDQL